MKSTRSTLAGLAIILAAVWIIPAAQAPVAQAAIATFSGHGSTTTSFFFLSAGLVTATFSHNGTSNFIVHAVDASGQDTLFLVNEIGAVSGTSADRARFSTNYLLTIQADGDWTIALDQPHPSSAPFAPQSYAGHGQQISQFVQLFPGVITVRATHNGHSNFIVHMVDTNGVIKQFIFNEIGAVNASQAFGLNVSGIYFFDIDADGDWTLTVEQTSGGTPTPTFTPTQTFTPTLIPTSTWTPTPTPSTCSPRPPVRVTTTRAGNGQVSATIAVTSNAATPPNSLRALTFGAIRGATVQLVVGGFSGTVVSGQRVPISGSPVSAQLVLSRSGAGPDMYVPFTVTDACGDWKTFVGLGTGG